MYEDIDRIEIAELTLDEIVELSEELLIPVEELVKGLL